MAMNVRDEFTTVPVTGQVLRDEILRSVSQLSETVAVQDRQAVDGQGRTRLLWWSDVLHERNWTEGMILGPARDSERSAGGSGDVCLRMTLKALGHSFAQLSSGTPAKDVCRVVQDSCRQLSGEIVRLPKVRNLEKTWNILGGLAHDRQVQALVLEGIKLSGAGAALEVVSSQTSQPCIELTQEHRLHFGFPSGFGRLTVDWKRSDCSLLIVDGFIETVGEINRLLEEAAAKKQSLLLVCRGMSPDVLNTLSVNMIRKSLDVLPVIVPVDVDGVNALKDLATVAGTDVISSLKGEVISTRSLDDTRRISRVTVTPQTMSVICSPGSNVGQLVEEIKAKIEEADIDEMRQALNRRLRFLSARSVKIMTTSADQLRSADLLVRSFNSTTRYGIVDVAHVPKLTDDRARKWLVESLHDTAGGTQFSLLSLHTAIRKSCSATCALVELGCAVALD